MSASKAEESFIPLYVCIALCVLQCIYVCRTVFDFEVLKFVKSILFFCLWIQRLCPNLYRLSALTLRVSSGGPDLTICAKSNRLGQGA